VHRQRQIRWLLVVLLAVLGAGLGIALTLAAGGVCVDGVSESFCGHNFLVWNFSSGGAFAWAGSLGALAGASLGLVASATVPRQARSGS
jgi:hypothetical protein